MFKNCERFYAFTVSIPVSLLRKACIFEIDRNGLHFDDMESISTRCALAAEIASVKMFVSAEGVLEEEMRYTTY